jgi:hypothetical protein
MNYSIFGLQRSGTSFLEALLASNFDCRISNGINWKHRLTPPQLDSSAPAFNIYKNPYTWIESVVFRDPADLPDTQDHLFGTTGPYTLGHDSVDLQALCKLYNNYVLAWQGCGQLVQYETLIEPARRDAWLNQVAQQFQLTKLGSTWTIPEPGSLFMSEGFSNDSIPYYLAQKPISLEDQYVDLINQTITDQVFELLGYTKIV